jgi:hypothetical protein
MRRISLDLALAGAFGACFLAVGQNVSLKPGKYETTAEAVMSGSPVKMPVMKNVECMSETDLKAFVEKRTTQRDHCTISEIQVTGNKASYTVTCTNNGRTTVAKSEWTFASDSFQHVLETKTSRGPIITTRIVGKRIGECTN